MENSFRSIIDRSKSILILVPADPSFDEVAASLALYLALRQKKDVQIYSPTPMTVEFNRLIGVNKITQDLGNKNLIIGFADYNASDIERVSYDIENGQFRLTIIPKPQTPPPKKEQVKLSYSGFSGDCIILIGGVDASQFPALSSKELSGINVIHIGVRDLSLPSRNLISFSRPGSSISEVVASLIKNASINFDEDIATNLLGGIEYATNGFSAPSTSPEVFALVSELMRAGGKRIISLTSPGFPYTSAANRYTPSSQRVWGPGKRQFQPQPEEAEKSEEKAPEEWLQPKIYKGTSIS